MNLLYYNMLKAWISAFLEFANIQKIFSLRNPYIFATFAVSIYKVKNVH